MFGRAFKIGNIFGIDITLSFSFIFIALLFIISYGVYSGILILLLLFGSVFVHELGHSLVAKSKGVLINEIELHFFGGAAKLRSLPKTPNDEIIIAASGPIVSFVLGIVGLAIYLLLKKGFWVRYFFLLNFLLAGFNLLPALPMDGGRILRAYLSKKYGYYRATLISGRVAKYIAFGMGIWALIPPFNLFLLGIALLLWFLSLREVLIVKLMYGTLFDNMANSIFKWIYGPYYHKKEASNVDIEVYDKEGNLYHGELVDKKKKVKYIKGENGDIWIIEDDE